MNWIGWGMADSGFVHLHTHSEYSLLDGAIRMKDLVARAAQLEMPAVAVTDHGNMYAAVEFYTAAREAKVKPIIGCEMYLAPASMADRRKVPGRKNASHLTLLVENDEGYRNLVRLVSKAHLEGFYHKPRIDKALLARHSEGLICLSGCINGEINQFLVQEKLDEARESLRSFVDIFGADHFFLEMHNHGMESQIRCNEYLRAFGDEFGLRTVVANDVHFLNRADHEAHDVMICIGTGARQIDENRMRYSEEVYFKEAKEMRALFPDDPAACDATLEIAERCNISLKLDATSIERYPKFKPPEGKELNSHFRELCEQGLVERYGRERVEADPELRERLEREISLMEEKGFVSYFLIVRDFILWAVGQGIPVGPGRGSAAGSLVAYVLRITDLCPLKFGLIFERFLNPERVSPPDIDIDFCQTRRAEVIEYVRQKYGERSVSHIITFGKMLAKSVVRDVARVLGWSYGDGDRVARMIPTELKMTLSKARQMNPELKEALANEGALQELWRYATYLEGLTRNAGIHAAGVVMADYDLTDVIPLTRGSEGEVVTQYAMSPLTLLGMLKMDFLGLKTLTVINDAAEHVRRHKPDFVIGDLPHDDAETYSMLQRGETAAVFQLESGGMARTCKQLGVDCLDDIIALLALYRPGPMSLIPSYIARKNGKEKVKYLHPLLEEASKETFGILIYQEQVMKATTLLAGYSLGEADLLRRAMGKKNKGEMTAQREKFVEGCARVNGIGKKQANEIFDLLEKFADYGFNKSHSAAYSVVAYQTAYLKANHPTEFMAAVLSNEVNNTDKIAIFVAECLRMGLEILPPDVNRSQLKFAPENTASESIDKARAIRYGLAAIKNVGESAVLHLLGERERGGKFTSLDEFCTRIDPRSVNRKAVESLIRAGAFDWTGEKRWQMMARVEGLMAGANAAQRDRDSGQVSLFDTMDMTSVAPSVAEGNGNGDHSVDAWTRDEMLSMEKELLGFYVSGHPLDAYRGALSKGKFKALGDLAALKTTERQWKKGGGRNQVPRHVYSFAGFLEDVNVRYSKKSGKPFATIALADFTGHCEAMVWGGAYEKFHSLLVKGEVVRIDAVVESDDESDERTLIVEEVRPLEKVAMKIDVEGAFTLVIDSRRTRDTDLARIQQIASRYRGQTPLHLLVRRADGSDVRLLASDEFAVASDNVDFLHEVELWRSF